MQNIFEKLKLSSTIDVEKIRNYDWTNTPSITWLLWGIVDGYMPENEAMQKALERGTVVHKFLEDLLNNNKDWLSDILKLNEESNIFKACMNWLAWMSYCIDKLTIYPGWKSEEKIKIEEKLWVPGYLQ